MANNFVLESGFSEKTTATTNAWEISSIFSNGLSITVEWDQVQTNKSYIVYRKTGAGGTYQQIQTTRYNSIINYNLAENQEYFYKIEFEDILGNVFTTPELSATTETLFNLIDLKYNVLNIDSSLKVPYVNDMNLNEVIIGDIRRSASGKIVEDIIAKKWRFNITTAPMTRRQAATIVNYIHDSTSTKFSVFLDFFNTSRTFRLNFTMNRVVAGGRDQVRNNLFTLNIDGEED